MTTTSKRVPGYIGLALACDGIAIKLGGIGLTAMLYRRRRSVFRGSPGNGSKTELREAALLGSPGLNDRLWPKADMVEEFIQSSATFSVVFFAPR